jgi:hypothetical protein
VQHRKQLIWRHTSPPFAPEPCHKDIYLEPGALGSDHRVIPTSSSREPHVVKPLMTLRVGEVREAMAREMRRRGRRPEKGGVLTADTKESVVRSLNERRLSGMNITRKDYALEPVLRCWASASGCWWTWGNIVRW